MRYRWIRLVGIAAFFAIIVVAYGIGAGVAGPIGGILIAVAVWFFVGRFNQRQATQGLIDANLTVYFMGRQLGVDHLDALTRVITSRYPRSESLQERVAKRYAQTVAHIRHVNDGES